MKTCEEIRRENLLSLIKEAGGEFALAERYGCTEANIKTMARAYKDSKSGTPKGIGSKAARQLESIMGKPRGWLDHDHDRSYARSNSTALTAAESNNVTTLPTKAAKTLAKLSTLVAVTNETGHAVLLYEAEKISKQYPIAKANPAS